MDAFACYELCVQGPGHVVNLLRGAHGAGPLALREDFCGTAAVARRWVRDAGASALAIDIDAGAAARARDEAARAGVDKLVRVVRADCLGPEAPEEGADVVFAGNFSIGYIYERGALVEYLKASRERLRHGPRAREARGIFACDLYGGASALVRGGVERRHAGPEGVSVRYTWAHEEADARTGMVVNSISFRVERGGEVVEEWPRAFVYRWRLWGLPELGDALREAGYGKVELYREAGEHGTVEPVPAGAELGADWTVLVVARA